MKLVEQTLKNRFSKKITRSAVELHILVNNFVNSFVDSFEHRKLVKMGLKVGF